MTTKRKTRSLPASTDVYSDVHMDRKCTSCKLCGESNSKYTHPATWKSKELLIFLRQIEPDMIIQQDSCICRNCRESLRSGLNSPTEFHPRWHKSSNSKDCQLEGCTEKASRLTRLANHADIEKLLKLSLKVVPGPSDNTVTHLCDSHYRALHKELKPQSYQNKCVTCGLAIRGITHIRHCPNPDLVQKHLQVHAGFEGTISVTDKICETCYRSQLTLLKTEETSGSDNEEFESLVSTLQNSLPILPVTISSEDNLISLATKIATVKVAQELLANHALTLHSAYSIFTHQVQILATMSSYTKSPELASHRWLLSQLSASLQHHMAYTCKVKKHGVILYRRGKEIEALSYALHQLNKTKQDTGPSELNSDLHKSVCADVNKKIHKMISNNITNTSYDLNNFIMQADPVVWETISILTSSTNEKQPDSASIRDLRRAFILSLIMYCIDSRSSMPFQLILADIVDCYGGSTELLKILNRLGVCTSLDTLLRHIQTTVQQTDTKGILQGLDPSILTMFSLDNIDFLKSYAQVYCGNQQLSWHGTTVQAVQTKPSFKETTQLPDSSVRRRSHDMVSPQHSPSTGSPIRKRYRCRERTTTELKSKEQTNVSIEYDKSYNFDHVSMLNTQSTLSIELFHPNTDEQRACCTVGKDLAFYCLLKQAFHDKDQHMVNMQSFCAICDGMSTPEVANVAYVTVVDEKADSKDTVLHVINELYTKYVRACGKSFLVLEGDAKTYDIMQDIKAEYGTDLNWLFPYPGDWHLLMNYQKCLMKPFFEAGLKDMALTCGYSAVSISSCSLFKRTHRFLLEVWESLYRFMLCQFLKYKEGNQHLQLQCDKNITQAVQNTYLKLTDKRYDTVALAAVIRSLQDELEGLEDDFRLFLERMSDLDETWKFWIRFVFDDCYPYIMLFLSIRSGKWKLRMAALKSMAANFAAFDHPIYQRLISTHIVDMAHAPSKLLEFFESGGFAVSISGKSYHNVGLDEAHEMLINRQTKQAIVRPSKEYINRVAKYIPHRMETIQNFKTQLFPCKTEDGNKKELPMFSADTYTVKSEGNIHQMMLKFEEVKLLPLLEQPANRGLVNPFRNLIANDAQTHDLLNFHQIGQNHYENRIKSFVLKTPSTKAPLRQKKLQTFASTTVKHSKKVSNLQREIQLVQKCMRKKIAYANNKGTSPDVIAEQYIELPRAICNTESAPIKGQKSTITKFYQTRYKNSEFITHSLESTWTPETVIMEGMFIINTKPLNCHRTMEEYGHFLTRRFIVPYFSKGSKEFHMLFDNPGQLCDNPKSFEQTRRDSSLPSDHLCWVFFDDAEIPKKWNEMLKCRICKRRLTQFLSAFFVENIKQYLKENQKFIVAGATRDNGTEALIVTRTAPNPYLSTALISNAEETDMRIWLHILQSSAQRILVLSPDTDTYHIGLPLLPPGKEIIIQLSSPGARELNLLHLHKLADLLNRDPELVHIPPTQITGIIQTLFVCTGCDYVSFFSGYGKATFLKAFFEKADFISNTNTGHLSKMHATLQEHTENGFLAFIRLVGCAYFKKHRNAFIGNTPESLFHSFTTDDIQQQHYKWLDYIRQKIWDRVTFEDEMIPSVGALKRHWQRSCWVIHMWRQATHNQMALEPTVGNGWVNDEGILRIDWDSKENMLSVRQRVDLLLKGCGCRSGCDTNRCGCKKNGTACGPGCRCTNCKNNQTQQDCNQESDDLELEVDGIMEAIFGEDRDRANDEEQEVTDEEDDDQSDREFYMDVDEMEYEEDFEQYDV